jgi:hypothetical protein
LIKKIKKLKNNMTYNNMAYDELVKARDSAEIGSEEYLRAKNSIEDIRGDTNNKQVANLTDLMKIYKIETDRTITSNRRLTLAAIGIALIALILQIFDFLLKFC